MLNQKSLVLITLTSTLFVACSPKIDQSSTLDPSPLVVNSDDDQSVEQLDLESNETEDFDRGDSETQEYATEYDIDMINFEYSLTDLQAKPGDTITINLTNSEGTHDLVITDLDVHSEHLDEGTSDVMTITIPEDVAPGTVYEYFCSVGDHRKEGMVGTITIL